MGNELVVIQDSQQSHKNGSRKAKSEGGSSLRKHAANISNSLPLVGAVVQKVGLWGPVGGLVGGDSARGAAGGNKGVVVGDLAETYMILGVSWRLKLRAQYAEHLP